jgi:large subunit ribosomal protein L4
MTTNTKKDTKKEGGAPLSATVYASDGSVARTLELPAELFGVTPNLALVHQVVVSMESNARAPIAHVKGRGDVRGGGKKPWKQKGTGRARHGSRRSPIWVGGGVTHGPTNERNFEKKINKKMKNAALASVLSAKFNDGEVLFVDMPEFTEPKTAAAKETLQKFGSVDGYEMLKTRRNKAALIAIPSRDINIEKSFQNMGNVAIVETRNLNPVSLLSYRMLIIANPETSIEALKERMK